MSASSPVQQVEKVSEPGRVVAVIGGATAGAEMAGKLAAHGVQVAVFEQNPRPYGKIEDGLPRWHVALRRKEYDTISGKLDHPNVHFVPLTKVGRDLDFAALVRDWGFHAVVMAQGAWRDRPLPVEGADAYVDRGLIYQNPFIIWFNHSQEKDYRGARYEPADDVIVVGGGLASIDVAKVFMLETTRARLTQRGVEVGMVELEQRGIPRTLAEHDLRFEELGLRGCTLFYRRRPEDMPLAEIPEDATPERAEKVRNARRKLLEKAMEKYGFRVEPLAAPDGLLVEGERLVGLRFRRTRIEGGRVIPLDETFERRGTTVVSSIGSIPEPLPGIPMKGELFQFADWELGRLAEYPTVFSAGNIVTGKGNIVASRKHAAFVEEHIESFLGLREDGHAAEAELADAAADVNARRAEAVLQRVRAEAPRPAAEINRTLARVHERQRAVGYEGCYRAWLERVTPPDLE